MVISLACIHSLYILLWISWSPQGGTPPLAYGTCGQKPRSTFSLDIQRQSQMSSARNLTHKLSPAAWTLLSGMHAILPEAANSSLLRLWDLAAGKTMVTLTHHKKSVRALAIHPTEYSFASGSAGGNNIKKWKCPEGAFVFNFSGHNAIINTLSVNSEGVFFSGGIYLYLSDCSN